MKYGVGRWQKWLWLWKNVWGWENMGDGRCVELGNYGRREVCGVGNVVVERAVENGFVETVGVAKNRVVGYFSRG